MLANTSDEYGHEEHDRSKFRFKAKRKSPHRSLSPCRNDKYGDNDERRDRPRKHRKRKQSTRRSPEQTVDEDVTANQQYSRDGGLDPDAAFRESLFDAMADDEAADYWQGVYGQPVHIYENTKRNPQGELERMTDDEYTAHVRAKMYEKTHQHLLEEKARREAARREREKQAQEGREAEKEAQRFRATMEASLKRGQARKQRRQWDELWRLYLEKWDLLENGSPGAITIASIPWPVESSRRQDVSFEEVERFILHASSGGQLVDSTLTKILKLERVRWHPDKIQQKLGGQAVSEDVMQAVTECFQFIDRLWNDLRQKP